MDSSTLSPTLPLNDGRTIPQLGLGVYKVADDDAERLVALAVESGYRHIDTASLYRNERGVGRGVRASGVPREELFVTTKVWNDSHGYEKTLDAFDESLEVLGLDYVDLYLIHWPVPSEDRYLDTWRALQTLRSEGRALSIGVSNFASEHLDRLAAESAVVPAINQIELHPWLQQRELRASDKERGIVTEAWSPLARGRAVDDETLVRLGAKHGKTSAQVTLRWHLQNGLVVIPKSSSIERVRANGDVFDFELDADDLTEIDAMDAGFRTGLDPAAG